jgi:hypothetical protein
MNNPKVRKVKGNVSNTINGRKNALNNPKSRALPNKASGESILNPGNSLATTRKAIAVINKRNKKYLMIFSGTNFLKIIVPPASELLI